MNSLNAFPLIWKHEYHFSSTTGDRRHRKIGFSSQYLTGICIVLLAWLIQRVYSNSNWPIVSAEFRNTRLLRVNNDVGELFDWRQ